MTQGEEMVGHKITGFFAVKLHGVKPDPVGLFTDHYDRNMLEKAVGLGYFADGIKDDDSCRPAFFRHGQILGLPVRIPEGDSCQYLIIAAGCLFGDGLND